MKEVKDTSRSIPRAKSSVHFRTAMNKEGAPMTSPTSTKKVITISEGDLFDPALVQETLRRVEQLREVSPGCWEFWVDNKQLGSRIVLLVNVNPGSPGMFLEITVRTLDEPRHERYEPLGVICNEGINTVTYDIRQGRIDFFYGLLVHHSGRVSIFHSGMFSIH